MVTDAMVRDIVEQVMATLRSRELVAPASSSAPAGGPLASATPPAPAPSAASEPDRPAKVFLTAEMLERRLASEPGNGRTIELAPNEFLTPAARDVVDERRLTVRQAAEALPAPSAPAAVATPGTVATPQAGALGLVIERPGQTVAGVLAALKHDRLVLVDYTQTDCWVTNTRRLCEAIVAAEVRLGVAMLPYAADAMVLANKVRGIRAVQGTRSDSVSAAVRHFGANLLVLEHTLCTYHEMRAMIRLFAAPRATKPQADVLMRFVAELEGA